MANQFVDSAWKSFLQNTDRINQSTDNLNQLTRTGKLQGVLADNKARAAARAAGVAHDNAREILGLEQGHAVTMQDDEQEYGMEKLGRENKHALDLAGINNTATYNNNRMATHAIGTAPEGTLEHTELKRIRDLNAAKKAAEGHKAAVGAGLGTTTPTLPLDQSVLSPMKEVPIPAVAAAKAKAKGEILAAKQGTIVKRDQVMFRLPDGTEVPLGSLFNESVTTSSESTQKGPAKSADQVFQTLKKLRPNVSLFEKDGEFWARDIVNGKVIEMPLAKYLTMFGKGTP